jgi:hypothetical protein
VALRHVTALSAGRALAVAADVDATVTNANLAGAPDVDAAGAVAIDHSRFAATAGASVAAGPGNVDAARSAIFDGPGLLPRAGAPTIDAATTEGAPAGEVDLNGDARVTGLAADMGALEWRPPPAVPQPVPTPGPSPTPDPEPAPPAVPAPPPAAEGGVAGTTDTRRARPKVTISLPSNRRCRPTRAYSVRVRIAGGGAIARVDVYVNGRRRVRVTGARALRAIRLRGLPRGRYRLEVRVRTGDGRTERLARRYRTCR